MNQLINEQEYPQGNRMHKSTLFCRAFEDKRYLLDLYNSVNGTNYQNPDDLEVNTLENVVYLSMKNDLSFLIDCNMSLYEHQSTYNPNMPLRGLLYFAQLYNKYIAIHNLNIYSSILQRIPVPKYIVFYNGTREEPDEQILLLSEAFEKKHVGQYVEGCLECEARMLNINHGHNRELMEKCRRLEEYAIFVSKVRQYTKETPENPKKAISRAVDECIEENLLADILSREKSEVLELVLTTFNKELYEKGLREDAAREAREAAEKELRETVEKELRETIEKDVQAAYAEGENARLVALIKKKLAKNLSIEAIADALEEEPSTIEAIIAQLQAAE